MAFGSKISDENRELISRTHASLSGALRALAEGGRVGVDSLADLDALLNAAREQGRAQVTHLTRITTAEMCFLFGWSAGYESASKGRGGMCMSEAWAQSPARLAEQRREGGIPAAYITPEKLREVSNGVPMNLGPYRETFELAAAEIEQLQSDLEAVIIAGRDSMTPEEEAKNRRVVSGRYAAQQQTETPQ